MKNLLYKEFKLAFHPTVPLFWVLSAMLLIPAYPYYVVLFYAMLGIFFVCLTGRENHDPFYTLLLPIRKRDLVLARFLMVMIVELVQLLLAIPFAVLRQHMSIPGNHVGMDANIAFFGLALLVFGVFNWYFLTRYYSSPDKVGKVFGITCVIIWVLIIVLETLTYVVPFVSMKLDTPDPQFLPEKLITLVGGAIAYVGLTWLAYCQAAAAFEKLDF